MNWAEAVVLIVIVSAGAKVLRTWLMARGGGERHILFDRKGNPTEMRKLMEAPRAQEEALRREVEELRERIKVLERIATASAIENRTPDRLAAEIEALREPKA